MCLSKDIVTMCGSPVPVVLAQAVQAQAYKRKQKNIKNKKQEKNIGEIIHV